MAHQGDYDHTIDLVDEGKGRPSGPLKTVADTPGELSIINYQASEILTRTPKLFLNVVDKPASVAPKRLQCRRLRWKHQASARRQLFNHNSRWQVCK